MGELLRDQVLRYRVALAADKNVADTTEPANNSQLEAELFFPCTINHQFNKEPIPIIDEVVLIQNREEIISQIIPKDMTNSLFQRRLLGVDDLEEIKQEERQGRVAGVKKLLAKIRFSGARGLDKFIKSLKSSGYYSLASRLQESRETITRAEPETPNEISAIRLQEPSQTITRAEPETPNESSANRLQEPSQTITGSEPENPHESSANRLQEPSKTITGSEPENPHESSANKVQELFQTFTIAELKPNKYSVNRQQESRRTITRAEQETPNEPCAGGKDYNNGSEENYLKPRDYLPSCHEEMLRKNYLSIMENVRVNDIMGHLLSGKVIEWNDMDVIKTKLKSEGNREALRHLMDILHKSSHTVLPIFIDCLNQTGYDYIADCLQDDMNCGDKIPSCCKDSNKFQMIMDNIQIKDIIDHLYSKYVIEWNDMDVIKTKLKSEGNREALGHLMYILHKSSPAVLPSFIDCLNQTGYDYVARNLQDDLKLF